MWRHFSEDEVQGLDIGLVDLLDEARERAGVPFIITCGKRTPEKNASLHGSASDSAHLAGLAVDLATGDDHTLNRVIYGLCIAGLGDRIGLYYAASPEDANKLRPIHVHVDVDTSKPHQVTWSSMEQN